MRFSPRSENTLRDPILIPVNDPSAAGEARRAAVALAAAAGFDEPHQGRVALVATEVTTNLVKHARGGETIIRTLSAGEGGGIEVLAVDRGPGIADLARCLQDGYSTAGTAGAGLGAIRRLSDLFDVTSVPAAGTALVARVRGERAEPVPSAGIDFGAVCLPTAGEDANGDGWAVETRPNRSAVLVVDGLGHGLLAATAAREAVRVFRQTADREPVDIIQALHGALRPTRGGAAAVAVIDHAARALRFAGIGNIAGAVVAVGRRQGLVSLAGTLGHAVRKVQTFEYAWPPGAVLVMHSDGLGSQWDLTRYPGLTARHPALVAGVLFRDFRRERDDLTAFAARDAQGATP
ncbi:MAG: SpoIIE family protein phosphatase [Rhodospirillales bacterium]|nr:SpoIIE family protein phosphatase [Rhodospirillales bacterium]